MGTCYRRDRECLVGIGSGGQGGRKHLNHSIVVVHSVSAWIIMSSALSEHWLPPNYRLKDVLCIVNY